MTSTQLAEIEDELKRLAESLAALNLEQNEILVDTEKAQDQIHLLRSRLDKKVPTGSMQRKLLEQESSDKLLMEERLLAAERKNDQLRAKSNTDRQTKHDQAEKPLAVPASQPRLAVSQREELPRVGPGFSNQEEDSSYYSNSSKGEYQPPLLFAETPSQPEETGKPDEDEEDILARIRRNMDTE